MKLFLKISAVVLLVGYLAVSLYLWGDNDRNRPCELFEITVADSTECNLLTRDDLRAYLADVLPNFDRERVYVTDIKKLISWYNLLVETGNTDFVEEKKAEAEPEKEAAEGAETK